tara:strand:+ start:268 stop:516 length:249 start_codon:yes stop_codon:yes gene_type:complete
MHELVNDPIDVIAVFKGTYAEPKVIKWNRRKYRIQSVDFKHSIIEGDRRMHYFSVSNASNYMKIRLDTETLQWRILEIYHEG